MGVDDEEEGDAESSLLFPPLARNTMKNTPLRRQRVSKPILIPAIAPPVRVLESGWVNAFVELEESVDVGDSALGVGDEEDDSGDGDTDVVNEDVGEFVALFETEA